MKTRLFSIPIALLEHRHGIKDEQLVHELAQRMMTTKKWGGRPILVEKTPRDTYLTITGTHRSEAARNAGFDAVPAVIVESEKLAATLQVDPDLETGTFWGLINNKEQFAQLLRTAGDEVAANLMDRELEVDQETRSKMQRGHPQYRFSLVQSAMEFFGGVTQQQLDSAAKKLNTTPEEVDALSKEFHPLGKNLQVKKYPFQSWIISRMVDSDSNARIVLPQDGDVLFKILTAYMTLLEAKTLPPNLRQIHGFKSLKDLEVAIKKFSPESEEEQKPFAPEQIRQVQELLKYPGTRVVFTVGPWVGIETTTYEAIAAVALGHIWMNPRDKDGEFPWCVKHEHHYNTYTRGGAEPLLLILKRGGNGVFPEYLAVLAGSTYNQFQDTRNEWSAPKDPALIETYVSYSVEFRKQDPGNLNLVMRWVRDVSTNFRFLSSPPKNLISWVFGVLQQQVVKTTAYDFLATIQNEPDKYRDIGIAVPSGPVWAGILTFFSAFPKIAKKMISSILSEISKGGVPPAVLESDDITIFGGFFKARPDLFKSEYLPIEKIFKFYMEIYKKRSSIHLGSIYGYFHTAFQYSEQQFEQMQSELVPYIISILEEKLSAALLEDLEEFCVEIRDHILAIRAFALETNPAFGQYLRTSFEQALMKLDLENRTNARSIGAFVRNTAMLGAVFSGHLDSFGRVVSLLLKNHPPLEQLDRIGILLHSWNSASVSTESGTVGGDGKKYLLDTFESTWETLKNSGEGEATFEALDTFDFIWRTGFNNGLWKSYEDLLLLGIENQVSHSLYRASERLRNYLSYAVSSLEMLAGWSRTDEFLDIILSQDTSRIDLRSDRATTPWGIVGASFGLNGFHDSGWPRIEDFFAKKFQDIDPRREIVPFFTVVKILNPDQFKSNPEFQWWFGNVLLGRGLGSVFPKVGRETNVRFQEVFDPDYFLTGVWEEGNPGEKMLLEMMQLASSDPRSITDEDIATFEDRAFDIKTMIETLRDGILSNQRFLTGVMSLFTTACSADRFRMFDPNSKSFKDDTWNAFQILERGAIVGNALFTEISSLNSFGQVFSKPFKSILSNPEIFSTITNIFEMESSRPGIRVLSKTAWENFISAGMAGLVLEGEASTEILNNILDTTTLSPTKRLSLLLEFVASLYPEGATQKWPEKVESFLLSPASNKTLNHVPLIMLEEAKTYLDVLKEYIQNVYPYGWPELNDLISKHLVEPGRVSSKVNSKSIVYPEIRLSDFGEWYLRDVLKVKNVIEATSTMEPVAEGLSALLEDFDNDRGRNPSHYHAGMIQYFQSLYQWFAPTPDQPLPVSWDSLEQAFSTMIGNAYYNKILLQRANLFGSVLGMVERWKGAKLGLLRKKVLSAMALLNASGPPAVDVGYSVACVQWFWMNENGYFWPEYWALFPDGGNKPSETKLQNTLDQIRNTAQLKTHRSLAMEESLFDPKKFQKELDRRPKVNMLPEPFDNSPPF